MNLIRENVVTETRELKIPMLKSEDIEYTNIMQDIHSDLEYQVLEDMLENKYPITKEGIEQYWSDRLD